MAELRECELDGLRPTQITVGMIEVADKRKHLATMGNHERKAFLKAHPIPAVFGPDAQLYLTDHHHLARALRDDGYDTGFFMVEANLSELAMADFWKTMSARQWVHPIDADGHACPISALPQRIEDLIDDPYRSLAGYVRDAGGFAKTPTAFEEFQWAAFFRSRIKIVAHPDRSTFEAAVAQALALAHSPAAKGLPGYLPAR